MAAQPHEALQRGARVTLSVVPLWGPLKQENPRGVKEGERSRGTGAAVHNQVQQQSAHRARTLACTTAAESRAVLRRRRGLSRSPANGGSARGRGGSQLSSSRGSSLQPARERGLRRPAGPHALECLRREAPRLAASATRLMLFILGGSCTATAAATQTACSAGRAPLCPRVQSATAALLGSASKTRCRGSTRARVAAESRWCGCCCGASQSACRRASR